ncbi:tyrosine kinase receptor Cad96Ca isoform X2 [Bactrocera neohumeralis]|uniref:tyrosine kinase receptor Cad96Ca isoform X2 n=2 Tax=Bactrocera tyroni species complex TaxID=98808 RepID=UPI002165FA72|nr:tyrosine kinase receptor Cad96Ca isoform X2 [Bactrocera neohumeralis]
MNTGTFTPEISLDIALSKGQLSISFLSDDVSYDFLRLSSTSLLNTPPILYVPERNWRIPETEPVGQIITRIRAEDPENDDMVFGLEPHFLSNFNNNNDKENLPFRIDSVRGIVYLNESLIGRGGENFFLYITVTDGDLTAKNEVFVNILAKENDTSSNFRAPPSVTNVVQNISQILPPFDTLPGVQSVRNKYSKERPTNHIPLNFDSNQGLFELNHKHKFLRPLNSNNNEQTRPTGRLKLTPITTIQHEYKHNQNDSILHLNKTQSAITVNDDSIKILKDKISYDESLSTNYSTKTIVLPIIFTSSCIFLVAIVIFGFLYRKHLCAISKKLKKKSKEEMFKKSNQDNLSNNLADNGRNSMVMQHWNGPTAYNNRYVPWERDPQQNGLVTSQLSSNATNGAIHDDDTNVTNNINELQSITDNVIGFSINASQNAVDNSTFNMNGKCCWEFPRHRLKFFNILGEGAFGQVWRCEANDIDGIEGVTTVAVKTLKENATESEKKDLMTEIEVMKSLEPHINVVRLLACCTDKDPLFVIIEFVNRGKLQSYLRNSRAEMHYGNTHGKSKTLTSGDLTSFMYQVAKGMDYLTSRGIIHRDLAARNILITDEHTCKVADFGFARDVVTSKIYERKSEGKLPIRWMAIESLFDNIFSVKSDVWSFGILMWEIVTLGSTPYPGISAADVMRKVRDGYRLDKPEHCRRELYNIMYYCWSGDPNERPTFVELVQMLDKLLHTEMDYIELERFPDHNYYNILNLSGEKL